MELPKIISVDDHVVEPAHVWQTWLPEKYREKGPRVERKRWGAFRLKKGAKYEMTEDPEGEWGDAWIYEDKVIYVQKKFVAIPKSATIGRRRVDVRQDGHDDDRDHLRRHAARLLGRQGAQEGLRAQLGRRVAAVPDVPAVLRPDVQRGRRHGARAGVREGLQRLDGRGVVRPLDRHQHPALHHAALGRRARRAGDPAQRGAACGRCASRSCRRGSTCRASTPATGTRCSRPAPTPAPPCACTSARRRPTRSRRRTRPPGVGSMVSVQQLDGVAGRLPVRRDHAPVPEAEDRVLRRADRVVAVRPRARRHGVAGAQRLAELQAPVPRAAVELLLRPRVRLLHLGPSRREVARRGRREQHLLRDRLPAHRHDVAELEGVLREDARRRRTDEQKYKILRGNAIRMLELDRV